MNAGDANTRHDGEEPQTLPKLTAALKELPARRVFVPPAIDKAVLNAARQHLEKPRHSPFGWLRSQILWPILATSCVLIAGLAYVLLHTPGNQKFAREDINHDGRVDILDAFQLARELPKTPPPATTLDFNADGTVDQRDVETVAAQAVKLGKGGHS